MSVFEPAGVNWRSVSPRYVLLRQMTVAGWGLLLVAGLTVAAWTTGHRLWWFAVITVGALTVLGVVWTYLSVRRIQYAEQPEDLLIRRGVWFRSLTVVPYGRMQFVDVEAGPLMLAFGVANVQLHTASASSDAHVPGLTKADADRLRRLLTERGEAQLAGL